MMIRRILFCTITMCVIGMSALAVLPAHNPAPFDQLPDELFTGSGYQAYVTSTVYELDSADGYLYTYEIYGATTKFTWFSVAMYSGTSISLWDVEPTGTIPLLWEPVEDQANPTSIEAFFKTGLTAANSALLWFTSPTSPVLGPGALAKLSIDDGSVLADGNVLVPIVPEPATIALLGLGWLAVRSYKRKR